MDTADSNEGTQIAFTKLTAIALTLVHRDAILSIAEPGKPLPAGR